MDPRLKNEETPPPPTTPTPARARNGAPALTIAEQERLQGLYAAQTHPLDARLRAAQAAAAAMEDDPVARELQRALAQLFDHAADRCLDAQRRLDAAYREGDRLRAFVRRLAERSPWLCTAPNGAARCVFCQSPHATATASQHEAGCLWLAARELLRSEGGAR